MKSGRERKHFRSQGFSGDVSTVKGKLVNNVRGVCEASPSPRVPEAIAFNLPTGTWCALKQRALLEPLLQEQMDLECLKLHPDTTFQEQRNSDQQPPLIKPQVLIEFLLGALSS